VTRKRSKRLPTVLTADEAQALLETVSTRSTTGLRNRCMLQVMLGAGLRVSEVCNLRGRDVDLQRGEVRVNDGKGGRDRVVPVDHETLQWLQQWANKRRDLLGLNGKDPFFVGLRTGRTGRGTREEGQGLTTRYVELLVARLAEAAGIDKRTSPHTLRHTYATRLLSEGYNIREVQELLGHSSVSTTEVYTHVNPEALRAKIQAAPEPAPTPAADPQVQALAQALGNLSPAQREALAGLLSVATG